MYPPCHYSVRYSIATGLEILWALPFHQGVPAASWGPGWNREGPWAGSPVLCDLGVGRWCSAAPPLTSAHSLHPLLPHPTGPQLKGQVLGFCDHPPHPLVGFSVRRGLKWGKRFPQFQPQLSRRVWSRKFLGGCWIEGYGAGHSLTQAWSSVRAKRIS